MAESALNKRMMKALARFHPVRVENTACAGTPDINCALGWIENKWLPRWPTGNKIVKVDHFTPQQRVWHKLRFRAGEQTWVMLQVGREYLLFKGEIAAALLGLGTERQLRIMAERVWCPLKDSELIACLRSKL